MKTLTKKLSVLLALSICSCSIFTGCGSKEIASSNPSAEVEKGEKDSAEKQTITIWAWDVALAQLQENAKLFNEKHPEVEFVFEEMGTDQIYSKLVVSLANGIGLPDVVAIEGEQMSGFGSKFPDKFLPLNDIVEKDKFLPIKISEVTVGENILAYPWDAAPVAMFYRSDIFEEAGIKAEDIVTWDDYISAGKQVVEKTGKKMMPLAAATKDTFYRLLLSELGSFYFDKDGNTQINSPESIRAMEMVKKIYDAGITQDYMAWDDYMLTLSGETVATIPDAVWMIGSIKGEAPNTEGNWGVMPLPKFEANGSSAATNGGSVIAVPNTTQSPDLVKEFLTFAMTDEQNLVNGFVNYGLYPSYIPVYENKIFTQGDAFFNDQKIYEIFNKYGQEIPMVNYTQNFSEIIDANKNAVAKILLNNEPIEDTMNALEQELVAKFGK